MTTNYGNECTEEERWHVSDDGVIVEDWAVGILRGGVQRGGLTNF